ncbi:WD40-repeat-containing domain protein [Mycena vulgaris]|nr:WD40-repeat-containing domain protein [Mycena vulgaris]
MYGALEGVDVSARKHWLIGQGPSATKDAIDDVCLVTDGTRSITVLGHGRDNQQLSFIEINDASDRCTLFSHLQVLFSDANQMVSAIDLKRPWNPAKKGGVSAVASMMQPLLFATGGYDHCIHLWTVQDDFLSASPEVLNIKHNSQVQSLLAIRDTTHKLVSAGADCSVHIWDLSSERVVHTIKTSNSVYHAHTTTSPFCTLLEVAHRELQFEVRDHRCVPTTAVQRFGYTTLQVHGRFMKGSSLSNCFASGDRVGHVRLWDLRSVKNPRAQVGIIFSLLSMCFTICRLNASTGRRSHMSCSNRPDSSLVQKIIRFVR